MPLLAPWALLTGLLAVPLVLLYMLRLRRTEVQVSSTLLWQQLLQDNAANTPWQRLRRNLLLLLQLLILAALVLALARPFTTVPALTAGRTTILLDASASMNATDEADGSTRFAAAQRAALDIIDTLRADDVLTLIRVGPSPEVLASATRDRALLRERVLAATPGTAGADWQAALALAAAGSGAGASADDLTVIIGDGTLAAFQDTLPSLPGEAAFVPVGRRDDNLAIAALATDALPGQAPQLFAEVVNYGSQDAEAVVTLRVDGALLTAERVALPAGGRLPLVSAALPVGFGVVEASVAPATGTGTQDFLALDDRAWAVAPPPDALNVLLVSDGNLFLEQVLRALPGVSYVLADPAQPLPRRAFDLVIFDGVVPPALPASGDLWFLHPRASAPGWFSVANAESTATANIITAADDDRTAYVDMRAVTLRAFTPVDARAWATPLISADGGVLLWAGERDGRQAAVLTFALTDSDLPLQIAWPILVANLVRWFQPEGVLLADVRGVTAGQALTLRAPIGADALRVSPPDGAPPRTLALGAGPLVYAETTTPGLYSIEALRAGAPLDAGRAGMFAVNLFDPAESRIAPRTDLVLGQEAIAARAEERLGQREFWPYVAAAAVALLLLEWWLYQRRNRAPRPAARRRGAVAAR